MSDAPLASICVLCYNNARYLPATLDSALAQTHPNVETIVVDDGSTDDSLAIARRYESEYPGKVRVFTHPNNENRGISETINLATRMSEGDYWSVIGSDDVLHPDKIEKQIAFLDEHPDLQFVYCHVDYIDADGKKLPGKFGKDITSEPDPVAAMILENPVPAMAVLARRQAVRDAGNHDPDLIYSDWDFWLRLFSSHKAGFIPEALVDYRVHDSNASIGNSRRTQIGHSRRLYLKLLTHVDNGLLNEKYRELIESQIRELPSREAGWLLTDCHASLSKREHGKAFREFIDALQASPMFVLNPRRLASLVKKSIQSSSR